MDDFIKPKEAIEILKVSDETLRTKYAQMNIRRTISKPYLYSRADCIRFRSSRTQYTPIVDTDNAYLQKRIARITRQVAKQQQINL